MYNYGNLAYKDYPQKKAVKTVPKKTQKKKVKGNHKKMVSRNKNLQRIAAILILALAAGFMISEFVTVHETRKQTETLASSLEREQANTSQKIYELESSVDLSEIEDEAYARLGMQRPEKYQTIYVNVPRDDVTDATAGDVEGVKNRIKAFFASIGSHIVEKFSIK